MTDVPPPVRLLLGESMETGEVHVLGCGQVGVFTRASPLGTGANEDAAAVIPLGPSAAVLAVADGCGGMQAGERASAIAVRELRKALDAVAESSPDAWRSAVLTAFERANEAVVGLGVGAATTLAAVLLTEGTIRPFHAGESMILVVGQRGRVKLQTVSHSPVGSAVEAGLLDEHTAMHHDDRHLVSNMIGSNDMRIEVGAGLALAPRDTLVLASDGLFDNLTVAEVAGRAGKGPLAQVLEALAAECLERMCSPRPREPSKADDVTFLAYRRHRRRGAPGRRGMRSHLERTRGA